MVLAMLAVSKKAVPLKWLLRPGRNLAGLLKLASVSLDLAAILDLACELVLFPLLAVLSDKNCCDIKKKLAFDQHVVKLNFLRYG